MPTWRARGNSVAATEDREVSWQMAWRVTWPRWQCAQRHGTVALGARRLAGATRHGGTRGWALRDEEAKAVSVTRARRCESTAAIDGEQMSGGGGGMHVGHELRPRSDEGDTGIG